MTLAWLYYRVHVHPFVKGGSLRTLAPVLLILYAGWHVETLVRAWRFEHLAITVTILAGASAVMGTPGQAERLFMRAYPLGRRGRVLYYSMRAGGAAALLLTLSLTACLASLWHGTQVFVQLGPTATVAWLCAGLAAGAACEYLPTRPPASRSRRILPLPVWMRKEWGLVYSHIGAWMGPLVAVAGAVGGYILLPQFPPHLHVGVSRGLGVFLGLAQMETVTGYLGDEGGAAWLHAVAPLPARRPLLQKAVACITFAAIWMMPYAVAICLRLPVAAALAVLAQAFVALLGSGAIALLFGAVYADFARADRATKVGFIEAILIAGLLVAHAVIWLTVPVAGIPTSLLAVLIYLWWLRRQRRFTALRAWRRQTF